MPRSAADALAEGAMTGFGEYRHRFAAITRRARNRFLARDWESGQEDARERILLYDVVVHETLRGLRTRLRGRPLTSADAGPARERFRSWARERPDCEVAETFFNSVVRRLLGTVGVDPAAEFVGDRLDEPAVPHDAAPWHVVPHPGDHARLVQAALDTAGLPGPWHEHEQRVARAGALLTRELGPGRGWGGSRLEVLRAPFFRNKGAYLVARIVRDDAVAPLVLALLHPADGLSLDAVLPTSDEASVVFGFTRSYLHADLDAPRPAIDFLRSIMPLKREDELYTAIGFNRHGKTVFYRTLREHLASPDACFEPTPGKPGLVMSVFTLPRLNVVFKVIRDHFGPPKKTSRQRVMRNYGLIFVRDRVGRLADAQEYERLELPADRFSPAVLEDLQRTARRSVTARDGTLIIEHLYAERRVRPLDLYLAEVPPAEARRATLDFGQAIKDLAAADIFPGDMLVKNFGVTRHGRVIFYDYDEVALLTDCRFRDPPAEPYPEAELAAAPSYYVAPEDVFPAEWRAFLGPPGPLRQVLHRAHPELFDVEWWREMQARQRADEVIDFFPYDADRRLG